MEVSNEFGDDVNFVGIPGLSDVNAMERFVAETGTEGVLHIPDPDGVLWDRFDVKQHRTYVMINDDGTVEVTDYGSLREDVVDLIAS